MEISLNVSSAVKFKVLLLTVTLASLNLTVTLIFLLSAGAYCSLPENETVMIALPSATAITTPFESTVAILVSLEVNVRFPALCGFNVALIEPVSPKFKSKEVGLTVMLVGMGAELFTCILVVIFSLSSLAIIVYMPSVLELNSVENSPLTKYPEILSICPPSDDN